MNHRCHRHKNTPEAWDKKQRVVLFKSWWQTRWDEWEMKTDESRSDIKCTFRVGRYWKKNISQQIRAAETVSGWTLRLWPSPQLTQQLRLKPGVIATPGGGSGDFNKIQQLNRRRSERHHLLTDLWFSNTDLNFPQQRSCQLMCVNFTLKLSTRSVFIFFFEKTCWLKAGIKWRCTAELNVQTGLW